MRDNRYLKVKEQKQKVGKVGGTTYVAKLRERCFRSHGPTGSWQQKSDHLMWRFGGEARTKVGLSAAALTGRSAVLRQLNARRWCMIIRDFPVNPDATYADHPYAIPRFDQAFQAVNYVDSHRW
jgi:hypothetical protein